MNTKPTAHAEPAKMRTSLLLTIRGLGHVTGFKNSKVIARKRLLTKPQYAEWMVKCTDSFALQLLLEYRTRGGATQTGLSRHSWIACAAPLDDSVQWIPEETIRVVKVPKGQEGANVLIEPL